MERCSTSYTIAAAAAAAKWLQSCLTLCDPMDCSLLGFSVHGILQARTLEWVAISFSNAWKWKMKVKLLSHVWLLATTWTAAYQAPPSMGFSGQQYWSGVPLPSPHIPLGNCKLRKTSRLSQQPFQNGQHSKDWQHQMLVRRWINKNSHSSVVVMQNGRATLKDSLQVS